MSFQLLNGNTVKRKNTVYQKKYYIELGGLLFTIHIFLICFVHIWSTLSQTGPSIFQQFRENALLELGMSNVVSL